MKILLENWQKFINEEKVFEKAIWTNWSCIEGPCELVDFLVDRGKEVSFDIFKKNVDLSTATFLEPWQIKILPTDWSVTFLLSELPYGEKAWVLQHGGIEYVFVKQEVDFLKAQKVISHLTDEMNKKEMGWSDKWSREDIDKILKEQKEPKLKILHVGSLETHKDHKNDMNVVVNWVVNNEPILEKRWLYGTEHTYFDLEEKRDFLDPKEMVLNLFDVVVLHRIYTESGEAKGGFFGTSPKHNIKNWKKRLKETNAEYIFAVGDYGGFCICGKWLGNLSGYEKQEKKGLMTIYKKLF